MRSRILLAVFLLVTSLLCFAYVGDGKWLMHVPDKDRARINPYASDHDAKLAGEKLFQENCAECHGKVGEGVRGKPAVVSARVRRASDGELQWLLRNGSLWNGMPSWSSLPEQQRWQIITYLRELQQQHPAESAWLTN